MAAATSCVLGSAHLRPELPGEPNEGDKQILAVSLLSFSRAHAQTLPPSEKSQLWLDGRRLRRDQIFISFAANFAATRGARRGSESV